MEAGFCSLYRKIHYIEVRYIKVWVYKNDQINIVWRTYATYILKNLWITRAALSKRFHSLVDETISNSFRVGNCFLNFSSICEANYGDKKREYQMEVW